MIVERQKLFNEFMHTSAHFSGIADSYARFIEDRQLVDEVLWGKFIKVFSEYSDTTDDGWRSEYWGKMMRGGCMTYAYTRSERLYGVLTNAVEGLLAVQDADGRISGYDADHEFCGWDMWGRKYVLVGLEYYYEICRDSSLREKILAAMCRHLDSVMERIGDTPGQIPVTRTSEWWGGVNSCSILEPVVQLYKLTGKAAYKKFAEYIIASGGCREGSLIAAVQEGRAPAEFPVTKAYETMSFFEGLLAYYEISGKKEYLEIVKRFAESVFSNEITLIGCAGCTHELFDGAAEKQTEYSDTIMQETCVTVTWMRLSARLWENTYDPKYIDRIEQSARNALYGSINTAWKEGYSFEKKARMPALPFDSYSPLRNNVRGRGIGGFKEFPEGGFYGCCACIGSAGTALYPLYAIAGREKTVYVNFFLPGEACLRSPCGQEVVIRCSTDYPAGGEVRLAVGLRVPERFLLAVRIPGWSTSAVIRCGGKEETAQPGYAVLDREWKYGDTVFLQLAAEPSLIRKNEKIACVYGPLALARDENKGAEIESPVTPLYSGGKLQYGMEDAEPGEQLRIRLKDGKGEDVLLTDYASCGKNWTDGKNRITVWMNEG